MTVAISHKAGNSRRPLAERGHDLYETPPCATRALVANERLPHRIWEPACGRGAIARVLREAGHDVWATDLVLYDTPDQDLAGDDFLRRERPLRDIGAIVTNPPFKAFWPFVERAVALAPEVHMLGRLNVLGGKRERTTHLIEHSGLAVVRPFRGRLPMMHRDGYDGPRNVSAIDFAWFTWRRGHRGPTVVERISPVGDVA